MDVYGCRFVLDLFTLAFDSSPIKGEGIWSVDVVCPFPAPHLWIADQVRNDEAMLMHRFHPRL